MITVNKIEQEYLEWLTSQFEIHDRNPNTYQDLFSRLYDTEFVWLVPNDDNRVQDGLELRREFLDEGDFLSYRECQFWK